MKFGFFPSRKSQSGDFSALSREGYQKNAVVFRCVRLIAEAAASVPLCVRRGETCEAGDPAAALLSKGHPGTSAEEVMEQFYGLLQLSGNGYLEAALVDGVPAALYALRPDRVKTQLSKSGWPSGYEYEHMATARYPLRRARWIFTMRADAGQKGYSIMRLAPAAR